MPDKKLLFDEPCEAAAVDGTVEIEGPRDVELALTPEAAEETAARLEREAVRARGQRRLKNFPHKPMP